MGALKQGGTHPRPGRPPNELRGSMREILEKGLPHLEEFVTGERAVTIDAECPGCGETVLVKVKATRPADQLKAIDIAARYGLPKEPYDEDLIFECVGVAAVRSFPTPTNFWGPSACCPLPGNLGLILPAPGSTEILLAI